MSSFKQFENYLKFLRVLVNKPSVFTHPDHVAEVINYCYQQFLYLLPSYHIYIDEGHNLIAIPSHVDLDHDILYLSAHADTVDAYADDWQAPYHPFMPFEDSNQLVARGVNDCKAGVALQLYLAYLLNQNNYQAKNVIFTITFKEEGPGEKSAYMIAKQMGQRLPLSHKLTYLLVLENTVKLEPAPYLGLYPAERGNFVIELTDTLSALQSALTKLTAWNPIAIVSTTPAFITADTQIVRQSGGHICTIDRHQNKLTDVILSAHPYSIINAGELMQIAVVPAEISISRSDKNIRHKLILGCRSFAATREVINELNTYAYRPVKDFAYSSGFDISTRFIASSAYQILVAENNNFIPVQCEFNPGASDASTIYNALSAEQQKKFLPLVIGPGTRSQKNADPPRLTHGRNETFDKLSGEKAVYAILWMLQGLNFIT